MAKNNNLKVFKSAVLLNQSEIQVWQWRKYMEKNWNELTAHLRNATILFLSGRHGLEDGSIGQQDPNLMKNQENQVRINVFQ